jgi:energy-coupling factor transporter transmembrane protein EcfT
LHFLFLFRFTTTVTITVATIIVITIIATTVATIIVIAVVVVTNSNFMRGDWLPRRQLRLLLPLPSLPLTLSLLTQRDPLRENGFFFLSFPDVCPERVLANVRFLVVSNGISRKTCFFLPDVDALPCPHAPDGS